MIEWRLFEVKQHKYKLVLGWMTIWLVVYLIRRLNFLPEILQACYDHNINQEPNTGVYSKAIMLALDQKTYQTPPQCPPFGEGKGKKVYSPKVFVFTVIYNRWVHSFDLCKFYGEDDDGIKCRNYLIWYNRITNKWVRLGDQKLLVNFTRSSKGQVGLHLMDGDVGVHVQSKLI